MKAFIYTGGNIFPENITEKAKAGDLKIAADGGYKNALRLGVKVDILLGDFDSVGEYKTDENVEIIKVPAEKDFTDTQLAVETAIERGADEIVIIGGLSGRLDHTLSNISILEDLSTRRVHALITDGNNRIRFINSTSTLIAKSGYKYVSILLASEKAKGVSAEGCKYPLKNAKLQRNVQYAISNEIDGNCALISVRKGSVYIVESKDA
ncbi:MAG: thiamine diphosphokinase [Ruminococcaceae bacterium]|nr:thiamine diphosphokinase [Oscillospiraceae bacterium]